MNKSELRKNKQECDTVVLNDDHAGNELTVTIDIYGAQVQVRADSGESLIRVWELAKQILGERK